MKRNLIASLSFLLLACSCTSKITTLENDRDTLANQDDAYIFMAVETNFPLDKLQVSGAKNFYLSEENLEYGSNYVLLPVPAGKYKITKINQSSYIYYSLKDRNQYWTFDIKPGTINYIGHLINQTRGWVATIEMENRSSIGLEYLEENFPEILAERGIVYSGPGEDEFLATFANRGAHNE